MYKIIEHTADIGFEVEGASLEELFVAAAEATFDLVIESKRDFIPSIEVPISIDAPSTEQLLVRWLQEILFILETRRVVLTKFWIDEIDEGHLIGSAKGLKFDSTRHTQKLDIKAVTYHRLQVERDKGGRWHAQVILDI